MIVALENHLWQSTLFCCVVAVLTLVLRRNRAAVRHGLWLAASVKFLVPFSLLVSIGSQIEWREPPAAARPQVSVVVQIGQPFTPPAPAPLLVSIPTAASRLPAILFGLWLCGFAAQSLAWWQRWRRVRSALRMASPLQLGLPVPAMSTPSRLEPGVFGVFRPILILPEGIAEQLTTVQFEAVLEHELCHARRRDNLAAAVHMLVEALFWFHPLVWWLGARLNAERERACDESVLSAGGSPHIYAGAILKVCKLYLHSPLACAAGVSGADLRTRIEIIMESRTALRLDRVGKLLLGVSATAAIAIPLVLGLLESPLTLAQTEPVPSPTTTAERRAEQAIPRKRIPFDPNHFDRYVGYYQMGPSTIFTITRDGDHFLSRLTGQVNVEVFPESETKFFSTEVDAQISFATDGRGRVTELVLHQNGLEQHAPRVDESVAKNIEAALTQRIKNNTPSPGTEAALRHQIETEINDRPDYSVLMPGLAAATREQWPVIQQMISSLGSLKSITFKSVSPGGADVYDVVFERGRTQWQISPLSPDGKVQGLFWHRLP